MSKQEPIRGNGKDLIGPQVNIDLISNTGVSRVQVRIQVPAFLQMWIRISQMCQSQLDEDCQGEYNKV